MGKQLKTPIYEEFIEKFKPKKTTDDCYTPQEVYDVVLDYVRGLVNLEGREIVRPFYPGGDYQNYDYPEGCVVVDNPPFSIYTQIVRWYTAHGVAFFLFAPTLTGLGDFPGCAFIDTAAKVVYANGAVVNTSFITNLLPGVRMRLDGDFTRKIEALAPKTAELKSYRYPKNFTSAALAKKGVSSGRFDFPEEETAIVSKLDNCEIFAKGMLMSDGLAERFAEFQTEEAERKAEEAAPRAEEAERKKINIDLSERESTLVKEFLNK